MAPTKEELEYLYWDQLLSGREIAYKLNVPAPTVFSWLKRKKITLRPKAIAIHLYQLNHPESVKRFSEAGVKALLGRKQSHITIARRVSSREGYTHSQETRKKMSQSQKGRHWTQEQRERLLPIVMKNRVQRPTRLEKHFQNIINKYSLPYKYVGDGYTWIAGRCPDFLNINGQKVVVEIFSRWWHDLSINPNIKPQHTLEETIAHYKHCGFSCIIIWEEELANEKAILEKVGAEWKLKKR